MLHPLRWLAFAAYFVSLLLPAFQGSDLRGYHLLLFGVVGLVDFNPYYGLPWLANLFFIASFLLGSSPLRHVVIAIGLLLALPALGIRELPGDGTQAMVAVQIGWGLRLWLGTYVLLMVDMLLGKRGSISPLLGIPG